MALVPKTPKDPKDIISQEVLRLAAEVYKTNEYLYDISSQIKDLSSAVEKLLALYKDAKGFDERLFGKP